MKDLNYAITLINDGKLDLAKDLLADLVQSDPQNREALLHLGMCYSELGNHEKAVLTLSECVKHHPDCSNAHVALGYAHSMLLNNKEAKEDFLKALEIDPANNYALRNLGNLYGKEKDYERAVECFEKVFAADPTDQHLAYGIGYACFHAGKYALAEKYLIAAIDLDRSTEIAGIAMELVRDIADGMKGTPVK